MSDTLSPPARILVVDDMIENQIAYEAILEDLDNVEVEMASSGFEALDFLADNQASLCLLDIQMPGMNGFELAEKIRQNPKTEELPVIFISASHTDEVDFLKGYETGACDYITKPIQPRILLEKVRSLIALARPWEQVAEQKAKIETLDKAVELTATGMQDLGYVISRDFQLPLRRIRQELLTVKKEALPKLSKETLDTLQTAFDRVTDMDRMARNVLNYSRAHSRKVKKERVALSGIVDKAWSSHGFEVAERGVQLNREGVGMPEIYADPFLLHMVIANFFSKGLEYIQSPNLYMTISAGAEGGNRTRFELKCPTVNIDNEEFMDNSRILTRQVDAVSDAAKVNANNLGLHLCAMAISRQGGEVDVSADGEGNMTFWFVLPDHD